MGDGDGGIDTDPLRQRHGRVQRLSRLGQHVHKAGDVGPLGRDRPAELVAERSAGVIALTGGPSGALDQAILAGQADLARQRAELLSRAFAGRHSRASRRFWRPGIA